MCTYNVVCLKTIQIGHYTLRQFVSCQLKFTRTRKASTLCDSHGNLKVDITRIPDVQQVASPKQKVFTIGLGI